VEQTKQICEACENQNQADKERNLLLPEAQNAREPDESKGRHWAGQEGRNAGVIGPTYAPVQVTPISAPFGWTDEICPLRLQWCILVVESFG
jgi:hypothetical protein